MTTLTLSYSRLSLPAINWKTVCFTALILMFASSIFYAWQINSLTKGSYLINSYQKKITKMSEENKDLQVSFAENSFLGQALVQAENMNFVKTSSVKFVQIPDNSFAMAKK